MNELKPSQKNNHIGFSSKLGALLAAAGSAVGIGNIWRFSTETGTHGGSAFLLVYIVCILLFGIPLLLSEFIIGRRSKANVGKAFSVLAPGKHWNIIGIGSVLVSFIIFCYYNVIIGWVLYYFYDAFSGNFVELGNQSSNNSNAFTNHFKEFISDPIKSLVSLFTVCGIVTSVIVLGVQKGIERISKFLVPTLFIIMIILGISAAFMPGAASGYEFLLKPDFSQITPSMVLAALAQCFYSFSLGMGLITYASYFKKDYNLGRTAFSVAAMDTLVAIVAGLIIFPAVFSVPGVVPSAGPSLVFVSLPSVFESTFSELPIINWVFSVSFYFILLVAAITSSIFLMEVSVAFLIDKCKITRTKASFLIISFALILGSLSALSFGPLEHIKIFDKTIFDFMDYFTSNIILPLTGLGGALFVGWQMEKTNVIDELTSSGKFKFVWFKLFMFLVRYVIPLVIVTIFIAQLVK